MGSSLRRRRRSPDGISCWTSDSLKRYLRSGSMGEAARPGQLCRRAARGPMRYRRGASMRGFIDLHSHWVAAIDDGVSDVEGSLELLRALREVGFDTVVAT